MNQILRQNGTMRNAVYYYYKHRYVSTLSPLAIAFNNRSKVNLNIKHYLKEETGLFGKKDLTKPESFRVMQNDAIERCDRLIEEALTPGKRRPMVEVFDELSDTLCQVADLSEFIRVAHPCKLHRKAAEETSIIVSGIVEKLNTHRPLFDALKKSLLNGDYGDKHVSELFVFDFEQCGIHLDVVPRERVVDLNDAILQIGQQFTYGTGLPRNVPRSVIPSHLRSMFGSEENILLTGLKVECADPLAREVAYKLYLAPDKDQELALSTMLSYRHELAELCGFHSFAERALKGSSLENPTNVNKFLNLLSDNLKDRAQQDFDQMLAMKNKESPFSKTLACWDPPYYAHKAKGDWLKVETSEYCPYFSLGACMDGFNQILESIYGISLQLQEMAPGESWSVDVYKLGVVHETEGLLGHIYCDFYERSNKPHQDSHFTIRGGKLLPDGTYQKPIVVLILSVTGAGAWGGPALLTPGAVDNLFHEMGHAVHSMLGRTKYQHVSGTRCPTDLAEIPSVLMEYFAGDPKVLRLFAKHFQTQEPMPEDMLQRLCASKQVFSASEMQQQVFYSALDQKYHSMDPMQYSSTTDIIKEVQKQYYSLPYVENTAWQHRFSHLVGYGAKYYSYLISRAIAWTIWRNDFASDPLSRSSGEKFRNGILKYGGSRPVKQLLSEYLTPEMITPESLANALADELDHHKDHIDRVRSICDK